MEKVYLVSAYISVFSPLLPIIIAILHFRTLGPVLRVLFVYIVLSLIADNIGTYLSYNHINNMFMLYIFTLIEFGIFCIVYKMLFNNPKWNFVFLTLIPLFGILIFLEAFYFGNLEEMNIVSRNVELAILIFFSVLYFFDLLSKLENKNVLKQSSFWINTGVLLYASGNFFLFLFSNYLLTESPALLYALYSIHSFLNIVFNAILALAFTKD